MLRHGRWFESGRGEAEKAEHGASEDEPEKPFLGLHNGLALDLAPLEFIDAFECFLKAGGRLGAEGALRT